MSKWGIVLIAAVIAVIAYIALKFSGADAAENPPGTAAATIEPFIIMPVVVRAPVSADVSNPLYTGHSVFPAVQAEQIPKNNDIRGNVNITITPGTAREYKDADGKYYNEEVNTGLEIYKDGHWYDVFVKAWDGVNGAFRPYINNPAYAGGYAWNDVSAPSEHIEISQNTLAHLDMADTALLYEARNKTTTPYLNRIIAVGGD